MKAPKVVNDACQEMKESARLYAEANRRLARICARLERHPDFRRAKRLRARTGRAATAYNLVYWTHNTIHSILTDAEISDAPRLLRTEGSPRFIGGTLRDFIDTENRDLGYA